MATTTQATKAIKTYKSSANATRWAIKALEAQGVKSPMLGRDFEVTPHNDAFTWSPKTLKQNMEKAAKVQAEVKVNRVEYANTKPAAKPAAKPAKASNTAESKQVKPVTPVQKTAPKSLASSLAGMVLGWGKVKDEPVSTGLKIEKDRDESNGLKRPSTGTICREIWDFCDSEAEVCIPSVKIMLEYGASVGWDKTTTKVQFYRWRQFNGVNGRVGKVSLAQYHAA